MAKDNLDNAPGPGKAKTQEQGKTGAGVKRRTAKQRLQERAKAAGISGWEKMTEKKLRHEIQRIKSEGGSVPDLRSQNEGRPKSLIKSPKIIEMKETHLMEEIEVVITDRAAGTITRGKKSRLIAILDVLANKAVRDKDVPAAKEYFDRTLGKARQEIAIEGEIKVEEQRMPTKAEKAAAKAYLDNLDEDGEDA